MFKKFVSVFITLIFLVTLTAPAFAQPKITLPPPPNPIAGEKDPGAAISPLHKGDKAPFTGVELSPKAVAVITAELDNISAQIKIEVDHAVATCNAQCDYRLQEQKIKAESDHKVMQAQLDAQVKDGKVLTQRITDLEKSQSHTAWWVAGGVVAGVLVTLASVFVVTKISNK